MISQCRFHGFCKILVWKSLSQCYGYVTLECLTQTHILHNNIWPLVSQKSIENQGLKVENLKLNEKNTKLEDEKKLLTKKTKVLEQENEENKIKLRKKWVKLPYAKN